MNKLLYSYLCCGIMVAAAPVMAADPMPGDHMQMEMKMMDTNSDGLVSKTEFMAYHEKTWVGMKKDTNGMVDAKMTTALPKMPDKK